MAPLVSVIIPSFNRETVIGETLDSLLAQTYANWEAIVVDDGSTDKTCSIIKDYLQKDQRIRFLQRSRTPKGACTCRNIGIESAKGEYIQFLDSDDLLHPDKLKHQVASLNAAHGRAIATCKMELFVSSKAHSYTISSKLYQSFKPLDYLTTSFSAGTYLGNFCFLTPRQLIEEAGGWNEELKRNQDGEFFCRVLLCADTVLFVPEAIGYYRKGIADSISTLKTIASLQAALDSYALVETHVLNFSDTSQTRKACADLYQRFIFYLYPDFPNLIKLAEKHVERLGGSRLRPPGSKHYLFFQQVVGWKVAMKTKKIINNLGLNPKALKSIIRGR